MTSQKGLNMEVRYFPYRVELSGDTAAIHSEANRILVCFRFSAKPYQLEQDEEHLVVLSSS